MTLYKPQKAALTGQAYGDVNGDRQINPQDALPILQAAAEKANLTLAQRQAAEVSGDGQIDPQDALPVLKKAVNTIASFPVEQ